jgi:hypothetical protein
VDKKETSQPSVNQTQNANINQPKQLKQLKQPKQETIHQNQSKPQQLNQPNRETIRYSQPPFNQGTQYQQCNTIKALG